MRFVATASCIQFVALALHGAAALPMAPNASFNDDSTSNLERRSPLGGLGRALTEAEQIGVGAAKLGKSASTAGRLERTGSFGGAGAGVGRTAETEWGAAGQLGKKKGWSTNKKLLYTGLGTAATVGGGMYLFKSQESEQSALRQQNAALAAQNDAYAKLIKDAGASAGAGAGAGAGVKARDVDEPILPLLKREEGEVSSTIGEANVDAPEALERRAPLGSGLFRGAASLFKSGKTVRGVEGVGTAAKTASKGSKWVKAGKYAAVGGGVGVGSAILAHEFVKEQAKTSSLANQNTALSQQALQYQNYVAQLQEASAEAAAALPAATPAGALPAATTPGGATPSAKL